MTVPIDLILISGFLGAGKTTFMRSLLDNLSDKKVGVLVNEFGSIGIDGQLIKGSDDNIKLVEINNGSIFCACLKDGFIRTLKAFAQQPIDMLLIENSGMADPSSMNSTLDKLQTYINRPYQYNGSICLVDCASIDDYLDILTPVQNQISSADLIILNKIDLIDEQSLKEIMAGIREFNEHAYVHETTFAQISYSLLKKHLTNHFYNKKSFNTAHNRPSTCTLEAEGIFDRKQIEAFYEGIKNSVFRIKGFVRSHKRWLHVDAVQNNLTINALSETQSDEMHGHSRIVIISYEEKELENLINKSWQNHCSGSYKINCRS